MVRVLSGTHLKLQGRLQSVTPPNGQVEKHKLGELPGESEGHPGVSTLTAECPLSGLRFPACAASPEPRARVGGISASPRGEACVWGRPTPTAQHCQGWQAAIHRWSMQVCCWAPSKLPGSCWPGEGPSEARASCGQTGGRQCLTLLIYSAPRVESVFLRSRLLLSVLRTLWGLRLSQSTARMNPMDGVGVEGCSNTDFSCSSKTRGSKGFPGRLCPATFLSSRLCCSVQPPQKMKA